MIQTAHTPERLRAGKEPRRNGSVGIYADDESPAPVLVADVVASDRRYSAPDTARRMAAAWNACAGVPTEALERGVVRQLVDVVEDLLSIIRDSNGVVGWHRNGDVARWDEFDVVGTAEELVVVVRGEGERR